jgi:putative membrane protein
MNFNTTLNKFTLGLALLSLCGLTAAAQTSTQAPSGQDQSSMGMKTGSMSSGLDTSDRTFVKKAAQGGMAEVEMGKLATERASDPDVKKFGQRMVDDHTKANDQLKQVASSKNITLPESLNAKDEATKKKLSALSGAAFDRAYMKDMVTDHTKDVSEFRHESASAKDPAIKDFASQTLPTLKDHLKEAKQIAPKVTGTDNQMKGSQMKDQQK